MFEQARGIIAALIALGAILSFAFTVPGCRTKSGCGKNESLWIILENPIEFMLFSGLLGMAFIVFFQIRKRHKNKNKENL